MVLVAMRRVSSAAQRREKWRLPEPEPRPQQHKLDTMPINWEERIAAAVAAERERMQELLAHVIAEIAPRRLTIWNAHALPHGRARLPEGHGEFRSWPPSEERGCGAHSQSAK